MKLLTTIELNLQTDEIICLLRRLNSNGVADFGMKDLENLFFYHKITNIVRSGGSIRNGGSPNKENKVFNAPIKKVPYIARKNRDGSTINSAKSTNSRNSY